MLVSDVLVNERACTVCSFLEPQDWPRLRRTCTRLAGDCSDVILRGALRNMLFQITMHLSAVKTPTEDDFHRVEFALRLFLIGQHGGGCVQKMIGDLVEVVRSWFKYSQGGLKNVNNEVQRAHKQSRIFLRATDPKLWTSAVQAYPALSLSVCKIILKWPLNYGDRDVLVGESGATLPLLAITAGPSCASIGCQLAVMLSCGSERRVSLLETELLSAQVVEALGQYRDNEDVVAPALGYLFNVAQCEESWANLVKLGVRPLCQDALQRMPDQPQVQQYAQYILDVLDFVEYAESGQQS